MRSETGRTISDWDFRQVVLEKIRAGAFDIKIKRKGQTVRNIIVMTYQNATGFEGVTIERHLSGAVARKRSEHLAKIVTSLT